MSRINRIFITMALSLSLLTAATILPERTYAESISNSTAILNEVLQYIDAYNITDAQKEELVQKALKGMVSGLNDPYSQYFTPEESQAFQNQLNLQYEGIGIETHFEDGKASIMRVFKGSPAEKAGIQKGDILTQVDGKSITDSSHVQKYILGKAGTSVTVTIKRGGKLMDFNIKREAIHIPAVTSALLPSHIGYIQISSFTSEADEEFAEHLSKLQQRGMKSLIIDLRNNPGGYVESAQHIAEHFIEKGILMYTKDNTGKLQPTEIQNGSSPPMSVAILVNKNSASASEILSGALHDHGIATLVGTTTFGKGRIQSVITLSDGGLLKLTTQQYVTPNMTDFNGKGLKPDIMRTGDNAQLLTAMKVVNNGKLTVTIKNNQLMAFEDLTLEPIPVIQKGNKVYLPSRIVAALTNAEPKWDKANQTLTLQKSDSSKLTFTAASQSVWSEKDETYLELGAIQSKFPAFQWNYKDGTLTLQIG